MTPRTRAPFAALAAALALTACGSDSGGDPAAPSSEPSTVTVTQTPEAEAPTEPEQQELTKQQLAKALPTLAEAPRTFIKDTRGVDTTSKSTRTASPESCLALYMSTPQQRTFNAEHMSTSGGVRYTHDTDAAGASSIVTAIYSYDEPYPSKFLDQAGAALSECSEHDSAVAKGRASNPAKATTIPTPSLGDQSFGVRIGATDLDLAIDYLWVRSGHNLISVRMITGYRQNNDAKLEKYAQGVLDDLKKG